MRRLALLALVSLLAAATTAGAQGRSAPNIQVVTLKITQGVTKRIPHPPEGDAGDVFWVTLTLFAIKPEFGKPAQARVGSMRFSYILHGTCSATGTGCKGTVDVQTMSQLPGGTISAIGNKLPIRAPFIVSISKGTGQFAGAKGKIVIAPQGQPRNVYRIALP